MPELFSSAGKRVLVTGYTGKALREFLFTEDLADAVVFMMKTYSAPGYLNVGTGTEITIRELAEALAAAAGWHGDIVYDPSKPDGMPRKVMDVSRLAALGWKAKTKLAYDWYVANRC